MSTPEMKQKKCEEGRKSIRSLRPSDEVELQTGEILISHGVISPARRDEALRMQQDHGGRIGEILWELENRDSSGRAVRILEEIADILDVDHVRPDHVEIPDDVLARVSASLASHYAVLPLVGEGAALKLATASPQDAESLDEIELLIGCSVVPVLAMSEEIQRAIKKHYGVGADTIDEMVLNDDEALLLDNLFSHALDDDNGGASIIRFVNQIITEGHRLDATDIHFEPQENSLRIRYRIDGLLTEVSVPPQLKQYQSAIASRIKVMARLDIAEKRLPQDGRIQARVGEETFDLRVSVLPTPLGEGVDLRLLRRGNVHLGLEELGYSRQNFQTLTEAARRPNGIILVTGPTGSGKTTSLYALLERINTVDRKIITVEDPIEYNMPGMLQMQVHEEIGFTFARALRSILRHDPDTVLVGEIRDPETAEIAIRMAMTGHLVLSTLHTNDGASTIARLVDMGLEPYLLASTINCVVAQRLVRRVCSHCKGSDEPEQSLLEPFIKMGFPMPEKFYRGQGCDFCRQSGYLGRTGIHEVFPLDEDFGRLVMERLPASAYRRLALEKGIHLMCRDGWDRVVAGETTVDEIVRLTQAVKMDSTGERIDES